MARRNQEISIAAECVPNIGAKGRRRRLIGGIGWSLATGAVFAVFATRDAPPAMFLVLAPFVAIAALSFFQAKEKT
jgi:hypothetical protein